MLSKDLTGKALGVTPEKIAEAGRRLVGLAAAAPTRLIAFGSACRRGSQLLANVLDLLGGGSPGGRPLPGICCACAVSCAGC